MNSKYYCDQGTCNILINDLKTDLFTHGLWKIYPAGIYLLKINNMDVFYKKAVLQLC